MTALFSPELQIEQIKNHFQLENFIETGCYQGDGLNFARDIGFQHLYSCDINKEYVDLCLKRINSATIRHQTSTEFLKDILPTINGTSLFWLDAHYPTYYGLEDENELTKFPLLEEVQLVIDLKKNYHRDVFVLDDLRVMLPENNPFYNPGIGSQFMVNRSIDDFVQLLGPTHDYYFVYVDTGNIIFVPKN
jgi:hypothetical protein